MSRSPSGPPRSLNEIDWASWRAIDRATLTFVIRDSLVLLIRKKRGLGAGKITGPGGRIEDGERAVDCAIREVEEELGVTPIDPRSRGELRFQFVDGYSIHVFVFTAHDCRGEACETDEAVPLWTPVTAIPYAEMWADDELWLPPLLAGRSFSGRFLFERDRMLAHHLELE